MPTLSHYQALLFDVDNTLTTTNKHFDQHTIEALQKFIDRGYVVGVCTGKSFPILSKKILPYFTPKVLHVVSGGAQIITTEGEIVWQKNIDHKMFTQLIKILDTHNADYFVVGKDSLYAHTTLIEYLRQHPFEPNVQPMAIFDNQPVALVEVYNLTPKMRGILTTFQDHLTIKIMDNHRTGKPYVDLTATGVNKAVAFEKWCELSNIRAKEVIGFGDSANDLEFLDLVGYSVAMGNATDDIKAVAHRVIGHADNNGLAEYLIGVISTGEL